MESSQDICSFLNRFEKSLDQTSDDADLDDVVIQEMDMLQTLQTTE